SPRREWPIPLHSGETSNCQGRLSPFLPSRTRMARVKSAARTVVGLDIEPSHLAAAEVRANGTIAIERGATAPLPPGLMRDGEVTDVEALAEALRTFFREHKLGRRVR